MRVLTPERMILDAPIFRFTADIQSRRRLGLTATLVREDGREGDVFSLIGPKRFDAPWKDIEAQGWIAPADCVEVRVTLGQAERMAPMIDCSVSVSRALNGSSRTKTSGRRSNARASASRWR